MRKNVLKSFKHGFFVIPKLIHKVYHLLNNVVIALFQLVESQGA